MSDTDGEIELLVAASDPLFGSTVVDAVEQSERRVSAAHVEPATETLTEPDGVDGAVVDSRVAEPATVVEQLTGERALPVVVLAGGSEQTITRALEAGATDVFPRTTTTEQYELVVERIASEASRAEGPDREQPYREVFENVSDGLVVHEPDTGEILDINERFCEITGYSREELVGETVDIFSADDGEYSHEQARERIRRAREEGPQLFEWREQHRDGHTFPVEVHLRCVELDGEERVLASVRDITEQKRREREYEQIFNSVQDAIVVFDPETGEFLDVNDSYRELFGYDDLAAIQEQGIEGLSASDEGYTGERGAELIREVSETGEGRTVEWRGEASDGERFWLEATLAPAEIGGEQRVLSIHRDITERRELERTYQNIFEGVSDGLVVHDPETGDILEVNNRYCEITGYDREELLDETMGLVVSDDPEWSFGDAVERIRRAREEGPQLFEFNGERKSGEEFVGEINLRTIELRGEERVLASVRDITERKRREQEYEQIFDGVNDAIAVFDPETGAITEVNEPYYELVGYDDLETIQELGIEGLSASDEGYTSERGAQLVTEASEAGGPETVEWQAQTADGDRIWLEVTLSPAVIRGEQRVLSIQRDITERKRRERAIGALQDATDRLQTAETPEDVATVAVETASAALDLPMAVCWLHDDDRLQSAAATDAAHEAGLVSGLSAERYEYEVFRDGGVTEYTPREHGPENPLETGVLLPLGEHGLVAAGTRADIEADGTVLDVAKALADHVTTALDRVEREQQVRESERRFRLIADRIDEVIYLAEPDFSQVLYVNPAYREIWGQSLETLYDDATAFLDAVDERDRECFEADFESMLADIEAGDPAESYEFEYRLRRPSGEVRWVHSTGYTVELPGEGRRFVGIVEDVTERKRREQRLEVFNRVLRHNLRNQVDVIRSHAEVLADQTSEDHPERIIAAVDELATIGARARKTDQIMSVEGGPTELDLAETLRETVEKVCPRDDTTTVTTELPEHATLRTNEQAVTTAVESALENALEHAESSIGVSVEESPEGYTVTVNDDGPGIPRDELVPIEAGTETTLRHGRGLGLWQLRWSVDEINGELSFDTTNGTTVRITVPDRRGAT